MNDLLDKTTVDENGVITWNSNGRVLPEEYVIKAIELKIPGVDLVKCRTVREFQDKQAIEDYKKRMENYKPSEEELYEMRSAFGPNTTVVNIITGQKIKL